MIYYKKEQNFNKNIECVNNYTQQVNNDLKNSESQINGSSQQIGLNINFNLQSIFYSPKLNACLYSFQFTEEMTNDGKTVYKIMTGKDFQDMSGYFIRNVSTPIENVFYTKDVNQFESKISELMK